MKEKVFISIKDFAIPSPKTGSIDLYSGLNDGLTRGREIHQRLQRQRMESDAFYEAEVRCQHVFETKKTMVDLSGRMDGIYYHDPVCIEEIKSGFNLKQLEKNVLSDVFHPYLLQVLTYGYLWYCKKKAVPKLKLCLVSSRTGQMIEHAVELEIKTYEKWFCSRLKDIEAEIELAKKLVQRRQKTAPAVIFPFANPRPGQIELIDTLCKGMQKNQPLLIQAPTGLGKTLGTLYPALKESLMRGQKVIYLTPKNSQHDVAINAVKSMQSKGANIKSITLSAKKKLCLKEETICQADYCEFAQNHYTKVSEHQLIKKLRQKHNLNFAVFRKNGVVYQVCPYELQMTMIPYVDVVVCDYNYVFSPHASDQVTRFLLSEKEKPNLLLDEAHNLPARAMDYFSPSLSALTLEQYVDQVKNLPTNLKTELTQLILDCVAVIMDSQDKRYSATHLIEPNLTQFNTQNKKLQDFLCHYLAADIPITRHDPVVSLCRYWAEFNEALNWATPEKSEFFISFMPPLAEIKISCCDASVMIKDNYAQFKQIICFSATLKPFQFYSQLMGLDANRVKMAEFSSPFSSSQRKLLIIPQISTRYRHRQAQCAKIGETINKVIQLQKGNYFVFFPSFAFMDDVFTKTHFPEDFKKLKQARVMSDAERKDILHKLNDDRYHHIVFAVQGGVFSEGVDYPGRMAIGAFIVGPPLPAFNWEQEKKKDYYAKKYQAGDDYAYTFPAMAKAIQAAGRIIRTENDKGLIVLLDDRFLQVNFANCMPKDWYTECPNELVSTSILKDIMTFWSTETVFA